MKPIFFHFLRKQSNSSFFLWNIFFCQSFIPASGNELFVYWKQYCIILSFSYKWKLLLKLGGSQFLKTKVIPARRRQFFRYFQRFQNFLKWKQLFCTVEMHFQQIFHLASGNEFSVSWKQCFLIRAIFLPVEAIIGIRRELIFKKAYYC